MNWIVIVIASNPAAPNLANNPSATASQIKERLFTTAVDITNANKDACNGTSCENKIGFGRISLWGLLSGEKPASTTPPVVEPETPSSIAEGTVIKLRDSDELYLVRNGVRSLLNPFVKDQLKITADPQEVSVEQFNSLPSGPPLPPLDNTLVKGDLTATVFVIKSGVKRPLSFFSFTANGFNFAHVVAFKGKFLPSRFSYL